MTFLQINKMIAAEISLRNVQSLIIHYTWSCSSGKTLLFEYLRSMAIGYEYKNIFIKRIRYKFVTISLLSNFWFIKRVDRTLTKFHVYSFFYEFMGGCYVGIEYCSET